MTAPYHVFVSSAPADAEWVHTALVPAFEHAGIRALTPRGFALGRPILEETERTITTSSRTLLLLSPEYVAGTW